MRTVIVPVWPKIFVLVESSLGETCYMLGLSTDCVVAFCKAYGANVAITRLEQRQVSHGGLLHSVFPTHFNPNQ